MRKKIISCILILLGLMLVFSVPVKADNTHFGDFDETQENYNVGVLVSCGDKLMKDIPKTIPRVISIIYSVIQVAVPIIIIIFGSLDLIKGVIAQKDDDIKKGQQLFIKRLIYGVLIFFVFTLVKLVVSLAADSGENDILDCAQCFLENDCTPQIGKYMGEQIENALGW